MLDDGISDELVARLRQGEESALGELLAICETRLRQMLYFRLDPRVASRVDVDDLLQEVFIDAQKRLSHFAATPEGSSAYVWLRLVAVQTLCDLHRRHLGTQARDAARDQSLNQAGGNSTATSMAHVLAGNLTSPSQAIQRAEAVDAVQRALQQMEEIDREVLALRNFEDLSNQEVAEVLGINQGAASLRYVRALKRLQQIMSKLPDSDKAW